jgi:GntR family transcriptional regulator
MPARRETFSFELDMRSGVPVYRQLIDQVNSALASGRVSPGDQLPTVRQAAVDLAINPNTVIRAYRELEIRGILSTQQGTGTFVTDAQVEESKVERERRLTRLVDEFAARAGRESFTIEELIARLEEVLPEKPAKRR